LPQEGNYELAITCETALPLSILSQLPPREEFEALVLATAQLSILSQLLPAHALAHIERLERIFQFFPSCRRTWKNTACGSPLPRLSILS
jgi:hypothetical protein